MELLKWIMIPETVAIGVLLVAKAFQMKRREW